MSTAVKVVIGLFLLVVVARLAATSLELMVLPAPAGRVLGLAVLAAAALGVAAWAVLRAGRRAGDGARGGARGRWTRGGRP